jgi:hypothetical protein
MSSNTKAHLRSKLLDQKPVPVEIVIDGDTYKLLPPTLKAQSEIQKSGFTVDSKGQPVVTDMSNLIISVLINIVHVEEEGKLVPLFSELDRQTLIQSPAQGLIADLASAALSLFNK